MAETVAALWKDTIWRLYAVESGAQMSSAPDAQLADLTAGVVNRASARALPCAPLPDVVTRDVPSLIQETPLTVTAGAEIAIAGFVAQNPTFDGVICLPDQRRTLWAHISAEEVISIRTQLTGTLLRAALPGADLSVTDQEAFVTAVSDSMSQPEFLSQRLATLTTAVSLDAMPPETAASLASAHLIGAELAATRAYWLGQTIALIGEDTLCAPYAAALEAQFAPMTCTGLEEMRLKGLRLAAERRAE